MATDRSTKTPDLSPDEALNCTCFNLRKAARAVTQVYDAALQPVGLKSTQFSLLAAAGAAEGRTVGQLAEALVLDRTTLTRNLAPLVRDGLISVEEGSDRRARLVEVTPAGRRLLKRAWPLWRGAQARMVGDLGDRQWADLLTRLNATVAAAQDV